MLGVSVLTHALLARRKMHGVTKTASPYSRRLQLTVPFSEFRKDHADTSLGISERGALAHRHLWYCLAIICAHETVNLRNSERGRSRLRARRRALMEKKQRRAFKLSYFILREEQAALRATADAVSALDVTLVRQDKRVHYLPGHRTKVSQGEW